MDLFCTLVSIGRSNKSCNAWKTALLRLSGTWSYSAMKHPYCSRARVASMEVVSHEVEPGCKFLLLVKSIVGSLCMFN